MSHHDAQHEESNPPAWLYLSVLAAAALTIYLLVNVAAAPWGWPKGSVEKMHQAEGLVGGDHGSAGGHH